MKYQKLIPDKLFFSLRFFIPPFFTLVLGKILFALFTFNFTDQNQYLIGRLPGNNDIFLSIKLNGTKARML